MKSARFARQVEDHVIEGVSGCVDRAQGDLSNAQIAFERQVGVASDRALRMRVDAPRRLPRRVAQRPMRDPDDRASAQSRGSSARAKRPRRRAPRRDAAIDGPGSTTIASPFPQSSRYEFVPCSVMADGFGARTSVTMRSRAPPVSRNLRPRPWARSSRSVCCAQTRAPFRPSRTIPGG